MANDENPYMEMIEHANLHAVQLREALTSITDIDEVISFLFFLEENEVRQLAAYYGAERFSWANSRIPHLISEIIQKMGEK